MNRFDTKREELGRLREAGALTRPEWIAERERVNRAERAEIRRLAAALKYKQAERAP